MTSRCTQALNRNLREDQVTSRRLRFHISSLKTAVFLSDSEQRTTPPDLDRLSSALARRPESDMSSRAETHARPKRREARGDSTCCGAAVGFCAPSGKRVRYRSVFMVF